MPDPIGKSTRRFLEALGLPASDLYNLPELAEALPRWSALPCRDPQR